ncbi:MAG: hypothetical protein L6Q71_08375, partial [Planctomycetes bacterium]|nr:hypothetical protein [Planctomycetota bacterium]
LRNRLALYLEADKFNLAIAHRFVDLDLPEYAWQFYDVIFKDREIGFDKAKSKIKLPGMLSRVLDLKRRMLTTFAEYADAISDKKPDLIEPAKNRFDAAKMAYDAAFRSYSDELTMAATSVRRALDADKGLGEKQKKYEEARRKLEGQIASISAWNEETFRAIWGSILDTEEELERQTRATKGNNERDIKDYQFELDQRIKRAGDAVKTMLEFREHLRQMSEAANVDDLMIPADEFERLIAESKLFRGLLARPETLRQSPGGEDEYRRFIKAVRGITLTDFKVLRAKVARLVAPEASESGDVDKSLHGIQRDLDFIREATAYKLHTPLKNRDPKLFLNASHFLMLDQLIEQNIETAKNAIDSSLSDRDFFAAITVEYRALKASLLEASFELAELKHAKVVEALQQLTDADRPFVRAQDASEYFNGYVDNDEKSRDGYLQWYRAAREAVKSGEPLPPKTYRDDPHFANVRAYEDMEIEYRRLRNDAQKTYQSFEVIDDEVVKRKASFGLASLQIDDWLYTFDFKRRNGYALLEPDDVTKGDRYGTFAFVEGVPHGLELASGVSADEGFWLERSAADERFREGPPRLDIENISRKLEELLKLTPGRDPHLYVAVRFRAGQLQEIQSILPRTGVTDLIKLRKVEYPGDFAGAMRAYYLPVLREFNALPNSVLVRNQYLPLRDHFQRVKDKLQLWLDNVDVSNDIALQALFESLSPERQADEDAMDRISEFYGEYFNLVARREPGLVDVQDAIYDFNFRLGELSAIRARLLLDTAGEGDSETIAKAQRSEARSREFFAAAGKVLRDYVTRFPNASGELARQIKIGDAFMRSEDYVFALSAYRKYFDERRLADWRRQRDELFYVANAIGEAYMKLGTLEGAAMMRARIANDQTEIQRQLAIETMEIDSAMSSLLWVTDRVRTLLRGEGEGKSPQNRLPPFALDAFVNLAQARIDFGSVQAGLGNAWGRDLLQTAADELRRDIIEGRIFDNPPLDFDQSLVWRDAQFQIGRAHFELAMHTRAEDAATADLAKLNTHLDQAERAFRDITERWNSPVERSIYLRLVKEGKSYGDAADEAGSGSAEHTDDIYYLAIVNAARVEWLRAVYSPDPTSGGVLTALRGAKPRLEFLLKKLGAVRGKNKNVNETTFTFLKLDRLVHYLLADVLYLEARTLRDRKNQNDPDVDPSAIRSTYRASIAAYGEAVKQHPNTYLAAWAYSQ